MQLIPLEADRLADFESLHAQFGGCYCAVWTATGDWAARCASRTPNLQETQQRVQSGQHVGFLVEDDGVVGWVGAGPRAGFPKLDSKLASRLVNDSDWVIGCFAMARRGLAEPVLHALIERATQAGARTIDAFPVRPWDEPRSYRGSERMYARNGFVEIACETDGESEVLVVRRSLVPSGS